MDENNNIINITEERISELEDRSIDIIQCVAERERKGKKRLKIKEKRKLDSEPMWKYLIKGLICMLLAPRIGEETEWGLKKYLKKQW